MPLFVRPRRRPCIRDATLAALPAASVILALGIAPAYGASSPISWAPPMPVVASSFTAIACPAESLCVATTAAGEVATSRNAGAAVPSWTSASVATGSGLDDVTCPTATFCAAIDGAGGRVFTTTDPTGGAGAWTPTTIPGVTADLAQVSCSSPTRCAVTDDDGTIRTSTAPHASWATAHVRTTPDPTRAVECVAGADLCVAGGGQALGHWVGTTAGSAWTVSANATGPGAGFRTFSCPTTTFCAAGAHGVGAQISTNPTSGPAGWLSILTPYNGFATAISCPSPHFCALGHDSGLISASADPDGGSAAWDTALATDPDETVEAIACASPLLCVAVDAGGNAIVGRTRPTLSPPAPTSAGETTALLSSNLTTNGWTAISCTFEFSADLSFDAAAGVPCDPMDVNRAPHGYETVMSQAALTDLLAGTTYNVRFRLVYDDDGVPGGSHEIVSERGTFSTVPAADTVPPTIEIASPADGQSFRRGDLVPSAFSCADAAGPVTQCLGPQQVDTSAIGPQTFTVTATDRAGNSATRSVAYTVTDAPLATAGPTPSADSAPGSGTAAGASPPSDASGPRRRGSDVPGPGGLDARSALRSLSTPGNGTVIMQLAFGRRGKLSVEGTIATRARGGRTRRATVMRVSRTVAPGNSRLVLKPNGRGASALRREPRLRVRLTIRFTPEGGKPTSTTRTVTVRSRR